MSKKTMYSAMNNLSQYICSQEHKSFDEMWDSWSGKYKPRDDVVPFLKRLAKRLYELDKHDIESVPEAKYREIVKRIVTRGHNS